VINIFKLSIPFILSFIISILIGQFKIFIFLLSITLFHELGHIIMGLIVKYKVEKVIILPLGALTIFNKKINSNIIKELLVTIMGPIFQIILFFFINQDKYIYYNLYLLIFNLLPIYPLDGYKLLQIFLYNVIPFNKVNIITLLISILVLILLLILRPTSIIIYFIFIIFLYQILKEYKNIKYIFNKFLFERYLYNIKFKKNKLILKKEDMYKYKSHTFIINNLIKNEKEILAEMFDKP